MHLVLRYSQAGVQVCVELTESRAPCPCVQHGLSNAPSATYKMDFLGLDPAQLPIAV